MAENDRDYHNPLGIPQNISEEAGTLELTWVNSNITATSPRLCLFDIQRGLSRFILHTLETATLVFSHWNKRTGIREASVSLKGLNTSADLYVALTWSVKEIDLYVGDSDLADLRKSKGLKRKGTVLVGKDGELCLVGDEGVYVPYASMWVAGQEIVSSDAQMIWGLTVTKVSKLFEGFELSVDYLFKTTLAQQCLVMLVTGFEVYTRERFGETERFNVKPADTQALIQTFDKKGSHSDDRDDFVAKGNTALESILEIPPKRGIINFQDWRQCKLAYKKGYGIVFSDLNVQGDTLMRIPQYFQYRHQIIHSKREMICLNIEKLPKEEPKFIYSENLKKGEKQFIEVAKDDFDQLVKALHDATENLSK